MMLINKERRNYLESLHNQLLLCQTGMKTFVDPTLYQEPYYAHQM